MRPVSTPAAKALLGNRSHASGADQTASWCSNLHMAAELDHPVRRNVEKFRRHQRTARYILVRGPGYHAAASGDGGERRCSATGRSVVAGIPAGVIGDDDVHRTGSD